MDNRFMDMKELTRYISTPKSTIYYWCKTGKIAFTKVGRKLLFDKQVIDAWLKGYTTQSQVHEKKA